MASRGGRISLAIAIALTIAPSRSSSPLATYVSSLLAYKPNEPGAGCLVRGLSHQPL